MAQNGQNSQEHGDEKELLTSESGGGLLPAESQVPAQLVIFSAKAFLHRDNIPII